MSTARPMDPERREAVYLRQTRRQEKTPRQRRRAEKKAAKAALRAVLQDA